MPPIGGDGLTSINDYLFRQNNVLAVVFAAAFATSYEFAGRSGELPLQFYDNFYWNNVYDCLFVGWVEKKTRKISMMPVVSNTVMEIDWYFAMFCFIVVNGGATSTYNPNVKRTAVFPNPECDGTNLNKKLREIREQGGFQDLMLGDVTTKAFRVGKMCDITNTSNGDSLLLCMIRGKWQEYMKQFYNVLEYWYETMLIAIRAARAGNGWKNSKQQVFIPNFFKLFDDATITKITNLCHLLCNAHTHFTYEIPEMKHMKHMCFRMFATFLMYLNEFITKYSVNHIVIRQVLKHAKTIDISLDELKLWGEVIKSDWVRKNAIHVESISDIQPALASLSEQLGLLKIENERMKATMNELSNQNKQLILDNKNVLILLQRIVTNIENTAVLHPAYEEHKSSPLSPSPRLSPKDTSNICDNSSLGKRNSITVNETTVNETMKKMFIPIPKFPKDNVVDMLAIWYGYNVNNKSNIEVIDGGSRPSNYVARIKKLMKFIEDNNIGESTRKGFTHIRSITGALKISAAKQDNNAKAQHLFGLVMKCLHSMDKKGETTDDVKLDNIDKRLIKIAKAKENAKEKTEINSNNNNSNDDNNNSNDDDTYMDDDYI